MAQLAELVAIISPHHAAISEAADQLVESNTPITRQSEIEDG